jgi:hypothetical protein
MLTPSIRSPEIRLELPVTLGQRWRGFSERLCRSQLKRGDHLLAGCFGALAEKDEMVVRGLAARLACSTERGQGRS